MEFRAYGNRLFVEEEPPEKQSLIQLPDGTRFDTTLTGIVSSVGPGVMTAHGWDHPQMKVGDRVAWRRGHGIPFPPGGSHCICLWFGEVMAVERDGDIQPFPNLLEAKAGEFARSR